ncbi:MAG: 8-amino-7-oxononanoate synthase, partial [Vulcanimicrobiaceae bacterium]
NEEAALRAAEELKANGFLAPAIRYPTVSRGKARLRVSLSAAHERADVIRLAECIKKLIL